MGDVGSGFGDFQTCAGPVAALRVNESYENPYRKRNKKRRRRKRKSGQGSEMRSRDSKLLPFSSVGCKRKKGRRPRWKLHEMPVLRPVGTQVPCAPQNSTQFIMDDHENSIMFLDFNNFLPKKDEDSENKMDTDSKAESNPSNLATPVHTIDSEWYKSNVADFESCYRSAREERLMSTSRQELRVAIQKLEERAAVLADALSASPSQLIAHLQSQLIKLQRENKTLQASVLRRQRRLDRISSSSSSTDSDSDSSDSSSSKCDNDDCETCRARRLHANDEEKENTRPSSPAVVDSTQEGVG